MEDIRWKQQAKTNWYKHGDRNTQYFYAWANQQRRSNHIDAIKDQDGIVWSNQDEIGRAFTQYFQHIFSTEGVAGIDVCTLTVSSRVTPAMNEMLTFTFSPKEIN